VQMQASLVSMQANELGYHLRAYRIFS
jgi:hypothetical protein